MANQDIENKKEALKTFVDQTKLLMTLASAFIVAPAAAKAFVENFLDWRIIVAEILFLISVLFSYIVLGTISGSQHKGDFNVYRKATRVSANIQFFTYLAGLVFFCLWLYA